MWITVFAITFAIGLFFDFDTLLWAIGNLKRHGEKL